MGLPTCLIDPGASIVVDASVAINLIATGCPADILRAIPHRVLTVDSVVSELEDGRGRGRRDADGLNRLVMDKLVEIVGLSNASMPTFEELVLGPAAAALDDGEAATIAFAIEHGAVALIDERKALRICEERVPGLRTGCSVDLFAHQDVEDALGRDRLSQAVVNALQHARMRVSNHHVDWVVGLIGPKNAASCASLPRTARNAALALASIKATDAR